ncbi:MAG: TetR/AcrR family transcriptional regulator [Limnothrix sp. RL_2_0]|nr:TetR/AcrR family transcriptional regulator [Limnothrix sp. RL_2_0]
MAGRKLTFDREVALEKAMDLFWEKGYNATGLTELLERMGIQRQSLYNAFGNKHDLFLAAIAHYGKTVLHQVEKQLTGQGSPLNNIQNFFYRTAENGKTIRCRGCLVVNTMIELSPHDPQVAAEVERLSRQAEKAFEQALKQAIAAGELPSDFDSPKMSRYLYHIALGLNARTKGTPNPEAIKETLDIALAVLHP